MTELNRAGPEPGGDGPFAAEPGLDPARPDAGSIAIDVPHPAVAAAPAPSDANHRYRSIWISDVHLGTRGCQSEQLVDFLRHTESDVLYLVGDIVDFWQLRRNWYWPERHNEVVRLVLRKAREGTRVIYIPGNHDEFFRDYLQLSMGGVLLMEDAVHVSRDGRRYLVIHGDVFDGVVTCARWLAHLGDSAYHLTLRLNALFNYGRRKLGYPYWSLSSYLKHTVKNAVGIITDFEAALVAGARERGVDGVICGHIHHPELRDIDGVLYANDGDWVENCTALVEQDDGSLALLRWPELRGVDYHELNG